MPKIVRRRSALEAAIRELPGVRDCAVLEVAEPAVVVAYLVTAPRTDYAQLREAVGEQVVPVRVRRLPRHTDGALDAEALLAVPVLTPELLRTFENELSGDGDQVRVELVPEVLPARRVRPAGPAPAAAFAGGTDDLDDDRPPAVCDGGEPRFRGGDPETLGEALVTAARHHRAAGVRVVGGPDLTYPELLDQAARLLSGLRAAGLQQGDPVLLVPSELGRFFPAFWACVLGGMRPVTVTVRPGFGPGDAAVEKLRRARQALGEPAVLSDGDLAAQLRGEMTVLDADVLAGTVAATGFHRPDPADPALLQLSSGSTNTSKLIPITHRAVALYSLGAREHLGLEPGEVTFNWLPMDHVGGLVMFHLREVFLGCTGVHAPTEVVVDDPLRWLDLLESERVQHTWAPNFGYKLVAEAVAAVPGRRWDLGRLRTMLNGGEQCTLPVIEDFLARTASSGMTPAKLVLSWGMAETCTGIVFKRFTDPDCVQRIRTVSLGGRLERVDEQVPRAERVDLLSMGAPAPGATLRVVDEDGNPLPEDRIGRLEVASDRITPGYLNDPAAQREAFRHAPWFGTGDLAFIRAGQVTITGRAKEMIIVNGANYPCHEIEDVCSRVDGVTAGSVAACGVPSEAAGTEALAVFFVPDADGADRIDRVRRDVRAALGRELRLPAQHVIDVSAREFPRTSSGKIQRLALRDRLLRGDFGAFGGTVPDVVYQPVWTAVEERAGRTGRAPGTTMVVLGEDTPGEIQPAELGPGTEIFPVRRPADGDWRSLLARVQPDTVLYLASCVPPPDLSAPNGPALDRCGVELLELCQALPPTQDGGPTQLITVSRGLHRIGADDPASYPAALSAALSRVVNEEVPGLDAWHLDLPVAADGRVLAEALRLRHTEREIAVRDGRAYVQRYAKVALGEPGVLPLRPDGGYLVVGGLGAVGREVVEELFSGQPARLLLIGRTPLDDAGADDRRVTLARLAAACRGEVRYRAVDISDGSALRAAVLEAETAWGRTIDGVLQLAGDYSSVPVAEERPHHWRADLAGKVPGTMELIGLLTERPGARLVAFSAMVSALDTAGTAAYTAANRFLEAACAYASAHGITTHCLVWGVWADTGLSRGQAHENHLRERGAHTLSPADGRALVRLALHQPPGRYLIGLNESGEDIAPEVLSGEAVAAEVPRVRTADPGRLAGHHLTDRLGRPVPVAVSRPGTTPDATGTGGDDLRRAIHEVITTLVDTPFDDDHPFFELGLGSIDIIRIRARLERALNRDVPVVALYEHPTVSALAAYLAADPAEGPAPVTDDAQVPAGKRVAIIGVAFRMPGARTTDEYWSIIESGSVRVRRFPDGELADGVRAGDPGFVPVTGALDDVDQFDADFFTITAAEAELTEPQQRIFLETCHEALEQAGLAGTDESTRVGVYAGAGMNLYSLQTYLQRNLPNVVHADPLTLLQATIGNQPDFLATRVAYRLGLTGPAIGVQTACSTSLVAVHLACRALQAGDTDVALAGAAAVHVPQRTGYRFAPGLVLSPDGVCRAFDAEANGTVGGNGVAVVVLKLLDRAIADGDTIHAVIAGSAINNDGARKIGYTAPSGAGQSAVITAALDDAGVDAGSIGYVEAHGTGTQLGDRIELRALTQAFRRDTAEAGYCAIGSAKPNLGHLDTCAGMAGLIKAMLVLQRSTLPPVANLRTVHPELSRGDSPFFVPEAARPWPPGPQPRRAGVSALGVGGTNAHVILEEAPPAPDVRTVAGAWTRWLPLSARSPQALRTLAASHRDHLRAHPELSPADLLRTTAGGRRHWPHRLAAFGENATALADSLTAFLDGGDDPKTPFQAGTATARGPARVTFICAGAETLTAGAVRDLYDEFPPFRAVADACDDRLRDWSTGAPALLSGHEWPPEGQTARRTALFTFYAAMAATLREAGLVPAAVLDPSGPSPASRHLRGELSLLAGLRASTVPPPPDARQPELADENGAASPPVELWLGRAREPSETVLSAVDGDGTAADRMALLLGRLYCAGASLSLPAVAALTGGRRIPLPTYPFDRRSYWLGPPP